MREVADSEAHIARASAAARGSQIVDYVFFLVYAVIALAILLEALGARESAGFAQFVNAISYPFLAPFKGLLSDPTVGRYQLMTSYIVALVNGALRMVAHRKTEV